MKIKKIITMAIAAIMAISSISAVAFADGPIDKGNATIEDEMSIPIEPFSFGSGADLPMGYVVSGESLADGNGIYTFSATTTYPYFKVWVSNESAGTSNPIPYKVKLYKKVSGVYVLKDSWNVNYGYTSGGNFYNNSNYECYNDTSEYGAGSYKVVISNTSNYPLVGTISIRREMTDID